MKIVDLFEPTNYWATLKEYSVFCHHQLNRIFFSLFLYALHLKAWVCFSPVCFVLCFSSARARADKLSWLRVAAVLSKQTAGIKWSNVCMCVLNCRTVEVSSYTVVWIIPFNWDITHSLRFTITFQLSHRFCYAMCWFFDERWWRCWLRRQPQCTTVFILSCRALNAHLKNSLFNCFL